MICMHTDSLMIGKDDSATPSTQKKYFSSFSSYLIGSPALADRRDPYVILHC